MASNPLGGLQWQSTWGTNAVPTRSALRQYAAQKAQAEARAAAEARSAPMQGPLSQMGWTGGNGGDSGSPFGGPAYNGPQSPSDAAPAQKGLSLNVSPQKAHSYANLLGTLARMDPIAKSILGVGAIQASNAPQDVKNTYTMNRLGDLAISAVPGVAPLMGIASMFGISPMDSLMGVPGQYTGKRVRGLLTKLGGIFGPKTLGESIEGSDDEAPAGWHDAVEADVRANPSPYSDADFGPPAALAKASEAKAAEAPSANPLGLSQAEQGRMNNARQAEAAAARAAEADRAERAAATRALVSRSGRNDGGFYNGPTGYEGAHPDSGQSHGSGWGGGRGYSGGRAQGSSGSQGPNGPGGPGMGGDKCGGLVQIKRSKSGALSRVRNKR